MNDSDKFIAFLESLRTEENSSTIDVVLSGYGVLEEGIMDTVRKAALPLAAAGVIGAGIGTGALDDSDLYEIEKDAAAQMKYSTSDLSNLIKDHESAIKSGDKRARAIAYDALKKANVSVGYDRANNFKFYWDKNLGRAFYADGSEVPSEERQYLPTLGD